MSSFFNVRQGVFFPVRPLLIVAARDAYCNRGRGMAHHVEVGKRREVVNGLGAGSARGYLEKGVTRVFEMLICCC